MSPGTTQTAHLMRQKRDTFTLHRINEINEKKVKRKYISKMECRKMKKESESCGFFVRVYWGLVEVRVEREGRGGIE